MAGAADDAVQSDLDHTAVSDSEHVTAFVAAKDLIQRRADASLEQIRPLAPWHQVPVRRFGPLRPGLRKSRGDLFNSQAFPIAKKDLAQRG